MSDAKQEKLGLLKTYNVSESLKAVEEHYIVEQSYEYLQLIKFLKDGKLLLSYNNLTYYWLLYENIGNKSKLFHGLTPIDCLKLYINDRYNVKF